MQRLRCRVVAEPERLGPYVAFGSWIRALRTAKFKSQPLAVRRASQKKLGLITQGKLSHIERGMNGNPDPEFLAQLAMLFELPYADVVRKWIAVRYEAAPSDDVNDLIRHGGTRQSDSHPQQGESVVPASDREVSELRRQVAEYKALFAQVENAASTLATVIAAGEQVGKADPAQPKTRRGHRKAG